MDRDNANVHAVAEGVGALRRDAVAEGRVFCPRDRRKAEIGSGCGENTVEVSRFVEKAVVDFCFVIG